MIYTHTKYIADRPSLMDLCKDREDLLAINYAILPSHVRIHGNDVTDELVKQESSDNEITRLARGNP